VAQRFLHHGLPDIKGAVLDQLFASQIDSRLRAGDRVAVCVGSRGIANIAEIVQVTVAYFRERGFHPFIVPAMGSHGGATAEGQKAVLAHYGITESSAGCPVVSSLDTISFGLTPEGIETWVDSAAAASNAIFLINRVKWHPSFDAPIESGLMKMAAIGLGKVQGATAYHVHATRIGMGAVVRSVGRHIFSSGKVLGGLAVVEDAHHQTGKIAVLPASGIEEGEQNLLELARAWMPRLPFNEIDILIIDEIGKDISGTGMDSKIVNRHPHGAVNPWAWAPRITRIYLRDLSPLSYGNANGLGLADMISERLYQKIDWPATEINALTASNTNAVRLPLRAKNDCIALDRLSKMTGRLNPESVTFVRIHNTLQLEHVLVSENLLQSHALPEGLEKLSVLTAPLFDDSGDLTVFPK
jgi:hypothetical protein